MSRSSTQAAQPGLQAAGAGGDVAPRCSAEVHRLAPGTRPGRAGAEAARVKGGCAEEPRPAWRQFLAAVGGGRAGGAQRRGVTRRSPG